MGAKEKLRKLYLLIKTSRPQFYFVPVYFYISAFVVLEEPITAPVIVQIAVLSFPLSFFINGVNDIYDTDTDALDDLRKEGEVITDRFDDLRVFKLLLAASAAVMLVSTVMFNVWNFVFVAAMVVVGYFYSAPPVRLKERPPFDSLSNGAIAVAFAFFAGASTFTHPTAVPLQNVAEALVLTLGIAAAHAYYAAVDYEPDSKAGLDTVATRFGKRFCVVWAMVAVALSYVVFRTQLGIYFEVVVGYILIVLTTVLVKPEPRYMLRAAHTMYPAFVVGVILFLVFDSEGLRVSVEQIGLEFEV